MNFPRELTDIASTFDHRLVFATVSGAHLYGFPSPDSDYDVRGCHVLPAHSVLGLRDVRETEERIGQESGLELDLVSHDVHKFCRLLLTPNGYVLEQLLSPHILITTPEHDELKAMVSEVVTRHHAHHYLGFARNQVRMFGQEPRLKTLLYIYRVLLTGIHLMHSGEIEASLPNLLSEYPQDGVTELIAAKTEGAEKQAMSPTEASTHSTSHARLEAELESARDTSRLPEHPSCRDELHEFVVRLRLPNSS